MAGEPEFPGDFMGPTLSALPPMMGLQFGVVAADIGGLAGECGSLGQHARGSGGHVTSGMVSGVCHGGIGSSPLDIMHVINFIGGW